MNMLALLALLGVANGCPDLCRCEARGRVYCMEKNLDSVPYGIPKDTRILYLQKNRIVNSRELNERLSMLPLLERVMLFENALTEMPVIQSPSLLRLELSGNKINRIPAGSVLPRIQWIDLSSNDLTDGGIDPDAFNDITSVRAMILNENSLTKFPVGLPSSIEQLYINDNKIIEFSTLAVQHLSQLQKVEMRNNRVNDQSFPGPVFNYWGELTELDLSHNRLAHFPQGLQSKMNTLRLSSNQMEYLAKTDFTGLSQLRILHLSFNRLRSIEDGSLEQLQSLQEIDLSGNDWNCDCYMRPLKDFLDNNPYHKGQREELVCGGDKLAGERIDFIQKDKMKCPDVGFNVTVNAEESAATVWWTPPTNFAPPFANWRLKLSSFSASNWERVHEFDVVSPLEQKLSGLHEDVKYRICLFNGYYWVQQKDSYCKDFQLPSASQIVADVTQYAVAEESDDLETIIGLLTGALIVILTLIIVAVMFWRSNRFSTNKNHTIQPPATYNSKYEQPYHHHYPNEYPTEARAPLYAPGQMIVGQQTLASNINTFQLKQQTLDAGPEFDVALVPTSEANTSSTEITTDHHQHPHPVVYGQNHYPNGNGVFV